MSNNLITNQHRINLMTQLEFLNLMTAAAEMAADAEKHSINREGTMAMIEKVFPTLKAKADNTRKMHAAAAKRINAWITKQMQLRYGV